MTTHSLPFPDLPLLWTEDYSLSPFSVPVRVYIQICPKKRGLHERLNLYTQERNHDDGLVKKVRPKSKAVMRRDRDLSDDDGGCLKDSSDHQGIRCSIPRTRTKSAKCTGLKYTTMR